MRTSAVGLAFGGLFVIGPIGVAHAQYAPATLELSGVQRPQGVGGVRVGEGTYLRLGIGTEVGYDTNVFYNDQNQQESATLRVTPNIELSNMNRQGTSPPVQFSLAASLLYREYLNEDELIRQERAFNPTFTGSLGYKSGSFTLSISDLFVRLEEAPYVPDQDPITRDQNQAVFQVGLAPGGGRIQTVFRYTNLLDIFETEALKYANRLSHDFTIDGSWRWLPKTALFLQGGVGYVQYLNDGQPGDPVKENSLPYRVLAGLRGLVTPKLTAIVSAGYTDAIYDSAPGQGAANPSGLSNFLAQVGLSYTPATFTTLGLAYSHQFQDSPVIGDFYDLDAVGLTIAQEIGAFILTGTGRYEYRRYQGVNAALLGLERNDHVFMTSVQADYFLQKWLYAGVGYYNLINRSNGDQAAAMQVAGLDYTKQLIVGRLGITY